MDLRAEPIVLSVPAVEKKRYYSVQLVDRNTFNYGYIGSRATGNDAGDYLVAGPSWKGEKPAGIKKVFRSRRSSRSPIYPHAALQPGRHAEREEGAGRLQGAAAVGVPEAAGAAGRARDRLARRSTRTSSRPNFFEYLDFVLQFAPRRCRRRRRSARKLASIGIGAGQDFDFKDLSLEHKAAIAAGHEGGRRARSRSSGRQLGKDDQRLARRLGASATARSTTATGCCAPRRRRPASTATTPSRRCIRMTKTRRRRRAARRQQAQATR